MPARPSEAGTVILREACIVYASAAAAALAGRAVPDMLGRPFTEFLVPEQREAMLSRHLARLRGEAVRPRAELALLLPDGNRRLVEAHAERDGDDVIVQLRDLTHRRAWRLRLEAVASLGAALQRELTEEAIHARLREGLALLGLSSALVRVEPGGVRILWAAMPPELSARFQAAAGTPLTGYLGRSSAFVERLARDGYVFAEDWGIEASRLVPSEIAPVVCGAVNAAGIRQALAVRLDERDGASLCLVVAGEWLDEDDGPAVRLFGTQAAAALAASRAIADLSRRNAQLGALNAVAELAGDATDLSTFFAGASAIVRPVAGYTGCAIFVADEATGTLVRVYAEGGGGALDAAAGRIPLASALGEVVRRREPRVVPVPFEGADAALIATMPFRSLAWVPLVARSRAVGLLAAGFDDGPAVAQAAVDLLTAVGAHYASAIESHGLVADLRRRLADLEAVHALAVRVHANAPGDLGTLLQDGCRDIAAALSAPVALIHLASDDRTTLRPAAHVGVPPGADRASIDLAHDPFSSEVMRTRHPVATDDITKDPRSVFFGMAVTPLAVLAVPLVTRADVRGVVYVGDRPGRRFTAGDVALANALAGALGVGMENAELYGDARRRVEELFILNEVGRAVAGSLDVDAVLREAAEGARRIVRTSRAYVILYDAARGEIRFGAGAGMPSAAKALRAPVPPASVIDRVLRDRRPAVVEDVERANVSELYRRWLGGRAFVVVPVILRGEPFGVLVADDERGPRRFTESDVERLTAVADRLAVALENARLYVETRRRAEELGLLHEVGRSLVETLDIEQVLGAGIRNLARMVDASDAYLALVTADGAHLEVRAVAGDLATALGRRLPLDAPEPPLAALAYARREPIVVPDALSDDGVGDEEGREPPARAYLAIPLVVREHAIGTAVIVERSGPRLFTPAEVERAAAVANQLAVAAENARLYEDLRRSYAELARAQEQLLAGERLAALGELSAVVAHEVRNPLGVIFNSLGSLRRIVRPAGDAKMLFDIVEEEADRLNRIVGDLLDFARPSQPELRPELLGRVVEDAVAAAVAQQGGRIEVVRDLDPEVPPVAMDARLVRQAVLNVAVNAVQAMPRGGRITLRTRRDGEDALLEIEDSGAGIPEEVRGRIFEPFFTTKASGTGLGLAVVKRIVEGHGGAVSVRSAPGAGTVFALRFPVGGPQGT
jgi:signal transduction histidine kinase